MNKRRVTVVWRNRNISSCFFLRSLSLATLSDCFDVDDDVLMLFCIFFNRVLELEHFLTVICIFRGKGDVYTHKCNAFRGRTLHSFSKLLLLFFSSTLNEREGSFFLFTFFCTLNKRKLPTFFNEGSDKNFITKKTNI